MKKLYIIIVILCSSIFESWAQSSRGQIALFPQVEGRDFDKEETDYLNSKIEGIIASNDYGALNYCDRFVLLLRYTLASNHISTSSPTRISKKYDLTFIIGDIIENKTFGAEFITISGIGGTEKKANKSAISTLRSNNPKLQTLFRDAKKMIVDYYTSNSQVFITKAKDMALMGHFEEGIAYLMSIPSIDESCTKICHDSAIELYSAMVDKTSFDNFQAAKAAWTASKNKEGARIALSYLKKVDIGAPCYGESLALWDEISDRLDENEIEEKEAAFMVYQDKVAFRNRLIEACEKIGVAFGQNRPKQITKLVGLW